MKNVSLILIVLFLNFNYNLISWEQYSPKNSNLKNPSINNIVKDSNNELIFMTNSEVGFFKGNKIISDTTYRVISDMYPISNCIDDGIGNLIFRSDNGIGIRNKSTNKWQTITNTTIPGLLFRNSIAKIEKDIYINASLLNTIYKLEYNNETKLYFIDKQKPVQSNNMVDNEFGYNMCFLDSLLFFANTNGLLIYDLITNNVKIFSNIESISLKYTDVKSSIFLKIIDNKLILGLKPNDSTLTLLVSNKSLREETSFDIYNYTTKVKNPQTFDIYDIDEYEDNKYIISCFRELLILDNDKFYNITTPNILGTDINLEWLPKATEILDNNIFIGTYQGGIFKSSISELLALKIETSVENEDNISFQPIVINSYPIPFTDKVQIDFLMKNENLNDLKVELYGLNGEQIVNSTYNINNTIGELYELKLIMDNLSKGIYIVKILGKNNKLNYKVIKY